MNTLADRIVYLMDRDVVSSYDLQSNGVISKSTLSKILNHKVDTPHRSSIEKLCKYFNVSKHWLLTGHEKETIETNSISNFSETTWSNEENPITNQKQEGPMNIDLTSRLLKIIEDQREDIRMAQASVQYALETQRELVLRLPKADQRLGEGKIERAANG